MMAAMLIVMVVFLAFGMHHGAPGTHDAGPPAAQQPSHMHSQPAGEGQEERK